MRHLVLLALALTTTFTWAAPRSEKDTLTNTRYVAKESDINAANANEAELALPDFPAQTADWFNIYVSKDFKVQPQLLLSSVMIAPDRTVRYVLNIKSAQGFDNISAEGIRCTDASFNADPSMYKVFAFGDTINKRWIKTRKAEWRPIGAILNTDNKIHSVLYRTFCEDGLPKNIEEMDARIKVRAGR